MRAVAVTRVVVDTYIDKLRTAGKAPATINRYTQVLGAAFTLAVERKKLKEAPQIRRLPERNVRRVFYEAPEIEAVLAAAPEHLKDLMKQRELARLLATRPIMVPEGRNVESLRGHTESLSFCSVLFGVVGAR
jgi:hypothetical protein